MMKRFFQGLSCWWFATMTPAYAPLTTIDVREQMRKRRLLSIVLLINVMLLATSIPLGSLGGVSEGQSLSNVLLGSAILLALWINQRGYLKCASLVYLLTTFLGAVAGMCVLPLSIPVLSVFFWPIFLILPVAAGLFLPGWGPLLLALIADVFMGWYVFYGCHSQIATYVDTLHKQVTFLGFTCTIISTVALFGTIYAVTTKKAVIQADRTVELERANQALTKAYTGLEVAYATIQKQALTDALTDLPNHRAVVEQLKKEMERARRYGRPFSVLFFDADRFKHVNDTYGHAAGDTVLRQIAQRASGVLRGGDTLGRFGGEEFVVLLPEANASEANDVAERIRTAVAAEPIATSEGAGSIAMTVSIGLATYPVDGASEQALLSQADEAMYIAKRLGRDQVRTAEEARQMGADIQLIVLLQEEGQREAAQREDLTPRRLRETYTLRSICLLLSLLEQRNHGMSGHAHAVSDLATSIAQRMGLETKDVARIGMAALLHDIGKVAVPDMLLQKTPPLSSHERELLQEHVEWGVQILETRPFLSDLIPAVRHHHERWDGGGYPERLAGEHIPLAARIIAVAEAYDAMQRECSYQASRSPEEAMAELQCCAGTQFDPTVVQVLSTLLIDQQRQQQSLQMVER